jgi:hypothetical protein
MNENSATKARRHKEFIYNKTFCVTLCPGVLVAIFIGNKKNIPDIDYYSQNWYNIYSMLFILDFNMKEARGSNDKQD